MSLHRKNDSRFEFHVNVIFVLILNEDLKAGFETGAQQSVQIAFMC